ncbi:MAG: hypothetical protein WCC17_00700 [Candidatus Nitrosopolaris sp.]
MGLEFSFAGFTTQVKRGMIGKHLDGLRSKMSTQSVNQHILKHGHTSKQCYYYNGLGNGRLQIYKQFKDRYAEGIISFDTKTGGGPMMLTIFHMLVIG